MKRPANDEAFSRCAETYQQRAVCLRRHFYTGRMQSSSLTVQVSINKHLEHICPATSAQELKPLTAGRRDCEGTCSIITLNQIIRNSVLQEIFSVLSSEIQFVDISFLSSVLTFTFPWEETNTWRGCSFFLCCSLEEGSENRLNVCGCLCAWAGRWSHYLHCLNAAGEASSGSSNLCERLPAFHSGESTETRQQSRCITVSFW